MRRPFGIAVSLILLGLSVPSRAQWEKIADFDLDFFGNNINYITSVYFLDLPGPARVGFVGTQSELLKTTDGGLNWQVVWDSGHAYSDYYVSDICFKDSITGWFSIYNGASGTGESCYRTTDGGITWTSLTVPNSQAGANGIYYLPSRNRLFIGTDDIGVLMSSDLGQSWSVVYKGQAYGFAFCSDSIGIADGSPNDSTVGLIRTTNGGLTWHTSDTSIYCFQPLAQLGTPVCFEADYGRLIIRRSDDAGATWRVLKDFGPYVDSAGNKEIGPYSRGYLRGDLHRLYLQTDSGTYRSIDSGYTWKFDGGPSNTGPDDNFYASNGIAIAGKTWAPDGGFLQSYGLWEENWPTSGVAEPEHSSILSEAVTVYPNPATHEIWVSGISDRTEGLSIRDPLGREYAVTKMGKTFDISSLPAGVYFVSDGISRAKFVKE